MVKMENSTKKPKGRVKDVDVIIGENIKNIRIFKNISQGDLANILDVSFQQIQKYENGKNRISAGSILLLSEALDVPILSFYNFTDGLAEKLKSDFVSLSKEEVKLLSIWSKIKNSSIKDSVIKILKTSAESA